MDDRIQPLGLDRKPRQLPYQIPICVPPHAIARERKVRPNGVVLGSQRFAQNSRGQLWHVPPSWCQLARLASVEPAYRLGREIRTTERGIRSLQLITEPYQEQMRSFDPRYGRETTVGKTKLEPPAWLQQ